MDKVSVIIPNYNHSLYLKQRIESVVNQTYKNVEVIILDDCSTDDSKIIIEQYRNHPSVSNIVYNQLNSGSTFRQWEKGLKLAKGNWIWIAESDDWAEINFLETVINASSRFEGIGIMQTNSFVVAGNGNINQKGLDDGRLNFELGNEFIKKEMVLGNKLFNASAVVFLREIGLQVLDSSITSLRYCGDWLFWIKILERRNIVRVYSNLNYFRQHENNVSAPSEKKGLFYLEGFNIYSYIKSKKILSNNLERKYEKLIASNLADRSFNLKLVVDILLKSLKVSLLFPVFFAYYKLKRKLKLG